MIDLLFDTCVVLLLWTAKALGTTYKAINIWIFCVIWPAVTLGLMVTVIVLLLNGK